MCTTSSTNGIDTCRDGFLLDVLSLVPRVLKLIYNQHRIYCNIFIITNLWRDILRNIFQSWKSHIVGITDVTLNLKTYILYFRIRHAKKKPYHCTIFISTKICFAFRYIILIRVELTRSMCCFGVTRKRNITRNNVDPDLKHYLLSLNNKELIKTCFIQQSKC